MEDGADNDASAGMSAVTSDNDHKLRNLYDQRDLVLREHREDVLRKRRAIDEINEEIAALSNGRKQCWRRIWKLQSASVCIQVPEKGIVRDGKEAGNLLHDICFRLFRRHYCHRPNLLGTPEEFREST